MVFIGCWHVLAALLLLPVRCSTQIRTLPNGPLILGYATHCGEDRIIREAREGVNVIIWFSTNLKSDANGHPSISFGLNATCIASVARELMKEGLETSHLVSIGGWDAPHPDTNFTAKAWWDYWKMWNKEVISRPEVGFEGFDGIDWDLEGNDELESPYNHFSLECIDLVGRMSQLAKRDGFIVTLVPPQSYMDSSSPNFDLNLTHAYADYMPQFQYHSWNSYAAFLALYGEMPDGSGPTFDLIDIQLYETYSRACQAINQAGQLASEYLLEWISSVVKGWEVDFGSFPPLQTPKQVYIYIHI
ncbi:hypothetical protein AAMO2058_000385000 [Amorphochlora amoebiformis]